MLVVVGSLPEELRVESVVMKERGRGGRWWWDERFRLFLVVVVCSTAMMEAFIFILHLLLLLLLLGMDPLKSFNGCYGNTAAAASEAERERW